MKPKYIASKNYSDSSGTEYLVCAGDGVVFNNLEEVMSTAKDKVTVRRAVTVYELVPVARVELEPRVTVSNL